MKLLIVLLFSMQALADVKIDISNINGKNYGAKFETQLEADAWIADNLSNSSWGKPRRWVMKISQNNCIQDRLVTPILGSPYVECEVPADYTITQTDITLEVKEAKEKRDKDTLDISSLVIKMKARPMTNKEITDWIKLKEGI